MRRNLMVLIVLVLLLSVPMLSGHSAPPKEVDRVAELMEQKLKESQKLLAGLALADYDAIRQHALELIAISNQTEWRVLRTPRYELYSNAFRRNAESLAQNAKEKNIDGATLAYMEMTMTCVKCHKHVREVRMTRRN